MIMKNDSKAHLVAQIGNTSFPIALCRPAFIFQAECDAIYLGKATFLHILERILSI